MYVEKKIHEVTLCTGSNSAHFSAAVIGSNPNFVVKVLTRRPKEWKSEIVAYTKGSAWESRGDIVGKVKLVTDDAKEACKGSKFYLICGPAHTHEAILKTIAPHVEKDSFVGTIYGQGGFAWMAPAIFKNRLKKDNITIWALMNLPSICKTRVYGESVNVIGPKKILQCAVQPIEKADMTCCYLDDLYGIPTVPLANWLIITLTPSNQIIHPGRVYGVFKDWDGKSPINPSKIPMLYEDMEEYSASQMQVLDDEIQLIKKAILTKYPGVDLRPILPLKERIIKQYGEQVKDKSTLAKVFSTNIGYKTAKFPMKQVEGGVVLDTNTRFFWEDIPYGLCVLKDIAIMLGVKTPNIDRIAEWHQKFMNKEFFKGGKLNKDLLGETGTPSKYEIKNIDQLIKVTCNPPKPNL